MTRHSSGEGVKAYYDRNATVEWERLERHRTEFAVTLRALGHYLPPPPAAILDVGGGPGRYAIALAAQGYRVSLTDLSTANLALAEENARAAGVTLAQILPVNALDLSPLDAPGGGAVYDSILLLGPLYHLQTAVERQQAIVEARRVLKTDGLLFAAFITRFAPIRDAAQGYPERLRENREYMEQLLQTGVHDQAYGFTNAYFAHPDGNHAVYGNGRLCHPGADRLRGHCRRPRRENQRPAGRSVGPMG